MFIGSLEETRIQLTKFQDAHGKGTMPRRTQIYGMHWTMTLWGRITYHLRCLKDGTIHPDWVELYDEFDLKEFKSSPQDSQELKETSWVDVRNPAEWDEELLSQSVSQEDLSQVVHTSRSGRKVRKAKYEGMVEMSDDEEQTKIEKKRQAAESRSRIGLNE